MKLEITVLSICLFCLVCLGCASLKKIVKTVDDVAEQLCLVVAEEQADVNLQGLSPEEWCRIRANLEPFIDAVLTAKQEAEQTSGLGGDDNGDSP